MAAAPSDPIAVVDAIYDLEAPFDGWAQRLATALHGVFDRGLGTQHFVLRHAAGRREYLAVLHFGGPATIDDQWLRSLHGGHPLTPYTEAESVVSSASDLARKHHLSQQELGFSDGSPVRDVIGLAAVDPVGLSYLQTVPVGEVTSLSPREIWLRQRIVVHLRAGLRLRARILGDPGAPGALLHPDGSMEPAAPGGPEALARLRDRIRQLDQARTDDRRARSDEALETWGTLLDGHSSLVDRFERDGRRYLVLHENPPSAPDLRALTLRERQVLGLASVGCSNKDIAHRLDIRDANVSVHLTRSLRKLGLANLADLRGVFPADAPAAEPYPDDDS